MERKTTDEVIALEVRQFIGEEHKTLVPRIIGQTAKAVVKKSTASDKPPWDEQSYFEEIEQTRGSEVAAVARKLLEWGEATSDHIWWGSGKTMGSFGPVVFGDGKSVWYILILVWTTGMVEVEFKVLARRPPFTDANVRLELLRRINEAVGSDLPEEAIDKYPRIDLLKLNDPVIFQKFVVALEWALQQIAAVQPSA